MSISEAYANQHIKKWIEGWNNHDIKTVLSMYSEILNSLVLKSKLSFPILMHQKLITEKTWKNIGQKH
jgi:hypothetical protein